MADLPIVRQFRELIIAYDEYIELLVEAESSLLGLAAVHGYRCPERFVVQGQQLREKINAIKSDIGLTW